MTFKEVTATNCTALKIWGPCMAHFKTAMKCSNPIANQFQFVSLAFMHKVQEDLSLQHVPAMYYSPHSVSWLTL